jgi:RNA polymerase sigma-70 factor (ECF subfamily)
MKPMKRGSELSLSQDEKELAALMKLAQQGDARSYGSLLTKVAAMMTDFVNKSFAKLGMADAPSHEDVVQEILLAIHTKRATYDPARFFLPWMYAIARYKVVDHLRRNGPRRLKTVPLDEEIESLEAIAAEPLGADRDVLALCESLPPKQREILKLVKLEGLSVAEASARTGYSPADVKVSVHRARRSLREKVGSAGHEE